MKLSNPVGQHEQHFHMSSCSRMMRDRKTSLGWGTLFCCFFVDASSEAHGKKGARTLPEIHIAPENRSSPFQASIFRCYVKVDQPSWQVDICWPLIFRVLEDISWLSYLPSRKAATRVSLVFSAAQKTPVIMEKHLEATVTWHKKNVPGTPSVLFFLGNWKPLKPATIGLNIGHLAFQVDVLNVPLFWKKCGFSTLFLRKPFQQPHSPTINAGNVCWDIPLASWPFFNRRCIRGKNKVV